jgi:hypothetical protein
MRRAGRAVERTVALTVGEFSRQFMAARSLTVREVFKLHLPAYASGVRSLAPDSPQRPAERAADNRKHGREHS